MNKTILVLSALISGCAPLTTKLNQFTLADARNALAISEAAGDHIASACYRAIIDNTKQPVSLPDDVTGALSLFEIARLKRMRAEEKIPESIHVACSPLLIDAERTILSFGILIR